ncbi:Pyrokinin-1 receptor, partial [Frankliniella fusca]
HPWVPSHSAADDAVMEANSTWAAPASPASPHPHSVQRDSLYIVVPVTVLYALIFVTGVVGNIVTVIVISRCRCMHTPTNYYLLLPSSSVCLAGFAYFPGSTALAAGPTCLSPQMSLAVSDLLLLLSGLPQEVYSIWFHFPYPFGEAFCVLRGLAAETSANASVLTIMAFTAERYLAICKPFVHASRAHSPSRSNRVFRMIAAVWVVALSCACVQAMQFGVVTRGDVAMCTQVRVLLQHSFEAASVVFFVAPMTLMCVLYALIARRLHRQRKDALGHSTSSLRHVMAKRRVIKMLAAVVGAFFLCWAPFHAQRLVATYSGEAGEAHHTLYSVMTYVSGVLHFVSATVNPILYQAMSRKFRKAGKDTLASLMPNLEWSKRRRERRPHPHGRLCGSGGGGQCRGTGYRHHHHHHHHHHRRHHPPPRPEGKFNSSSSSTSSSSSSSSDEMDQMETPARLSPAARGRVGGALHELGGGGPGPRRALRSAMRGPRGTRARQSPGLSPDRPDVVLGAGVVGGSLETVSGVLQAAGGGPGGRGGGGGQPPRSEGPASC